MINKKYRATDPAASGSIAPNLGRLSRLAISSLLIAGSISSAHAVNFLFDDFERVTLNDTKGKFTAQLQSASNFTGSDQYATTRFWLGGANGIELQASNANGFPAFSGRHMIELDTTANSSMTNKVNLVNGQSYTLSFQYRSRPKTVTTVSRRCVLFFCFPVTTTSVINVGGGVRAKVDSPTFTTGFIQVGDVGAWTLASNTFTYRGTTGEATVTFEATGLSDGVGTTIDDITLATNIPGNLLGAEALTGILPPHVPGLTSKDTTRADIVTPIVVNKQAAIALGKALFWDRAVGSDFVACASCHFNAGADMRFKNQVDPGINHAAPTGTSFELAKTGNISGPNYTFTKRDFPFDPNSDDIFGSSGTFSGNYTSSPATQDEDGCDRSVSAVFHAGVVGTRNVEPRNTPTVINAAYNHRNFWDGRANNEFNGVSPFGPRDKAAGVFINNTVIARDGKGKVVPVVTGPTKAALKLKNASLASQAVGPVGSDLEMACRGRQFADVGRKLLNRTPLRSQTVAATDSVLSAIPAGTTYAGLVKAAFAPEYWNGACVGSACGTPGNGVTPATPYNQMEANFSMYFGLSVQMYMETLVSDDTRFDRWKRGLVTATASEINGEALFNGPGQCAVCHLGPTMTSAAILQTAANPVDGMPMLDTTLAVYDTGFYNTGVVPTAYDIGNGGKDPWGNPLAFAPQYLSNIFVDSFGVEPCFFDLPTLLCPDDSPAAKARVRSAVNGAFKTPTLRNITLTGPYMHNGSLATLEQVVDFYNRGGNFNNPDKHPSIVPLGFTAQQKADLVAFMKMLTDDRVVFQKAPFDHPSLVVPNGHVGNQIATTAGNFLNPSLAAEEVLNVPAVGRAGSAQPLLPFFDQLPN